MNVIFRAAVEDTLVWLPEKGWGYYNVRDSPYDQSYLQNYIRLADTEIGKKLLDFRLSLVNSYARTSRIIDVGVGSGSFVRARRDTLGYDINPHAVEFLKKENLWCDYYNSIVNNITCWDSFEHIKDSYSLLSRVLRFVFISIPIFKDVDHVLRSKHFKKSEHCYYFTEKGLVTYMEEHDFRCLHVCYQEVKIGREDIGTFVFERNF